MDVGDTKFRQSGRKTARGPYKADLRRERAEEGTIRNAAWAALSVAEKLASLDSRLGKGIGARRQRRLLEEKKK